MGDNMIRRQYLPREVVFNLDRCYNHYFCLNTFMNEFKDENEFLIVDFKNASYEDILHGMEIYDYNKTHKYKIVFTSSYPDYMITQTDQLKVLFTTISKEDLAFESKDSSGDNNFIKTCWNNLSICDIVETEEKNVYKTSGTIWLF